MQEDGFPIHAHHIGIPQFNDAYSSSTVKTYPQIHRRSTRTFRNDIKYLPDSDPSAPQEQVTTDNTELTLPPAPLGRRRRGRPTKRQSATQFQNGKYSTGYSGSSIRRQMHNDSAMRSRARLNQAIEELWKVIPKHERIHWLGISQGGMGDDREVCRAVKVEVATGYLKKLGAELVGSDD